MNAATQMSPSPAPAAAPRKTRHCPKCGSARVHRSHRRGGLEFALTILGAKIRRCHDCRLRQAWFRYASIPLGRSENAAHWLAQVLIAAGGILLCLIFVWWVIQRSAADAG